MREYPVQFISSWVINHEPLREKPNLGPGNDVPEAVGAEDISF
jgi:hypothetical protein